VQILWRIQQTPNFAGKGSQYFTKKTNNDRRRDKALNIRATLAVWSRLLVLTNRKKHNNVAPPKQTPDRTLSESSSGGVVPSLGPRPPALPVEVWRRILAFVTRFPGANAIDREDPFASQYEPPESLQADAELLEDRKRLLMVCRTWRPIVFEIMSEYMVICCDQHLLVIVERLEKSKTTLGGNGLGEWTRRIDFQMNKGKCAGWLTTATPDIVVRLLRCTPNLAIYINNNISHVPEFETSSKIIHALVTYCGKSLRRVEWNCAGERPSWSHLQSISHNVPNLQTLRIACMPPYPPPPGCSAHIPSTRLKTLSLGLVPRPAHSILNFPPSWDPLLSWLATSKNHLPALEVLEATILPDIDFFRKHGHKIRCLRVMSWSTPSNFPTILHLCPNLRNLTLSLKRIDVLHLPPNHPSLQRICVLPFNEDFIRVPSWLFASAVLAPLDMLLMKIEEMDLCK